jgi:hypothetical protein
MNMNANVRSIKRQKREYAVIVVFAGSVLLLFVANVHKITSEIHWVGDRNLLLLHHHSVVERNVRDQATVWKKKQFHATQQAAWWNYWKM